MQVTCIECKTIYKFSNRWFKTNNPSEFICRKCKIIKTTRSKKFKEESSTRSKQKLSQQHTKSIMSQRAILSNIKNSDKISKSLREYYKNTKNKNKISENVKALWKNEQYISLIKEAIRQKWKDPIYRGNVLGSRVRITKKNKSLIKKLNDLNYKYTLNYFIGTTKFDVLINNKYLYDIEHNKSKKLFINHYFNEKYEYINDLTEVLKFEN